MGLSLPAGPRNTSVPKERERERKIHLFSFASLSTPTKKIKREKKLMK